MGPLGGQEMVFIFILALILFGPKKLPELGRTIAKVITEFRRASSDLKASFDREMHNLERETEALKTPPNTIASAPTTYTDYEYPYSDSYGSEPYEPAAAASTVSASEVPGAESHPASETVQAPESAASTIDAAIHKDSSAAPGVEGTVARHETRPEAMPLHS